MKRKAVNTREKFHAQAIPSVARSNQRTIMKMRSLPVKLQLRGATEFSGKSLRQASEDKKGSVGAAGLAEH